MKKKTAKVNCNKGTAHNHDEERAFKTVFHIKRYNISTMLS